MPLWLRRRRRAAGCYPCPCWLPFCFTSSRSWPSLTNSCQKMHLSHLALYCLSHEQGTCVFCLAFPTSLQTHISMPLSCLCFPHISGDGEVPLKPSDRSDHKCLKEHEISTARQVAAGQAPRTCRKLGPTASVGKKPQRLGLASWEDRRWKKAALIHWFTPGKEAVYYAAPYLGFINFFLPSVWLSESLCHCTSCPHFVLNQPSPNAA